MFVSSSKVSVPGCIRLYDTTLNALPMTKFAMIPVAVVVPILLIWASHTICCL